MVRLFGRTFGFSLLRGPGRALARARAAELRGELARATILFLQAGRADEAARVLVTRGDGEPNPAARLRLYREAATAAPAGSAIAEQARAKRAAAVVALAADGQPTAGQRRDLLAAAHDLDALGLSEHAADAYARAGRPEDEAEALARAGAIEKLDSLLSRRLEQDREALALRRVLGDVAVLLASGRRREAAALALASDDPGIRERGRAIASRRVTGAVLPAAVRGREMVLVLGDQIVVGRAPGTGAERTGETAIAIPSPALSRRHLAIAREGERFVVKDLGSRNGTAVAGAPLPGGAAVAVGAGIEACLGGEVAFAASPASEIPGALAFEIAGARYVAPLGPARLGIGDWRLERAGDGWIELVARDPPAFDGVLELTDRTTVLAGDAFSDRREAPAVLTIRGGGSER